MIERTGTVHAPFTVVEGNDRRFARIKALRTPWGRLEKELDEQMGIGRCFPYW